MTQTMTLPTVHTGQETSEKPARSDISDTVACPECGSQAVVEWRTHIDSTGGPLEHLKIRCDAGHWFFMPAYLLADQAA